MFDIAMQERLRKDLNEVAINRHSRWDPLGIMIVREFIKTRLSLFGVVEKHHFNEEGFPGVNYVLKFSGKNPHLDPIIVGAHYDGPLNSPGADDNASALVALFELARIWSKNPPNRPVWLVAFDQEEWGMLGSQALSRELKESKQKLKMMVSLEMLAYTSETQEYPVASMEKMFGKKGDFIALVSNFQNSLTMAGMQRGMSKFVSTKILPVLNYGLDMPSVRLSDHSPFWDHGYDALMVTDTSFMRNPNYHKESDTVDTLDIPFLSNVIKGLAVSLGGL